MEFDEWTDSAHGSPHSVLQSGIRSPGQRRLFRLGVLLGVLSLGLALWPLHHHTPDDLAWSCGSVLFPDPYAWSSMCEGKQHLISKLRWLIAVGLAISVTMVAAAVIRRRFRWVIALSAAGVVAALFIAFAVHQFDEAYQVHLRD